MESDRGAGAGGLALSPKRVTASDQRKRGNVAHGKPDVLSLETKERWALVEKVPALVPDWSVSMQMGDPHLHGLMGQICAS